MKKKYQNNAERQKAYRDRHRNARAEASPRSTPLHEPVTVATKVKKELLPATEVHRRDYFKDGHQFIYLGDWGSGPQYAKVVG